MPQSSLTRSSLPPAKLCKPLPIEWTSFAGLLDCGIAAQLFVSMTTCQSKQFQEKAAFMVHRILFWELRQLAFSTAKLSLLFLLLAVSSGTQLLLAQESDSSQSSATVGSKFSAEQLDFFETKIRPVLIEHCYECHGPESEKEGGLSVSSRKDLLRGGDTGPAIAPGDSQGSLLIEALRHGERAQMPPNGKLPVEIQADFIRWVEEKAAWPADSDIESAQETGFDLQTRRENHWAWQPIQRQEIPTVEQATWPADPLDLFILKKLESNALAPAVDVEPTRWLRRVYFDLSGLPPSRKQVEEFQRQTAQLPPSTDPRYNSELRKVKEQVVDHLLASSTFGEHWGRHWLDLVRFAETTGHEFDHPILNAFEYRDYVIRAFNSDVSYQRIVAEHLAGDLIPNPRTNPEHKFNESIIGTAFWYLGEANHAPVDSLVDEAGRMDNQIDVLGKAFLGMTVACARCHDHKFDAISAVDYHSFAGILQSMRRDTGVIDTDLNAENLFQEGQKLEEQFQAFTSEKLSPLGIWNDQTIFQLLTELDKQREEKTAKESEINVTSTSVTTTEPDLDPADSNWVRDLASDLLEYSRNESAETISANNPIQHVIAYAQRPSSQEFSEWWSNYQKKLLANIEANDHSRSISKPLLSMDSLFEKRLSEQGWTQTGWSFRDFENSRFGLSSFQTATSVPSIDSRRWARHLPGTLRSPTFEISSPTIHLRIRGDQAKVRLVIDSYRMNQFSSLLFEDCLITESDDRWHWRTMKGDIGRYIGHKAFLELIDEGPGGLAVSEIWMGETPPNRSPSEISRFLVENPCEDSTELAELFAVVFSQLNSSGTSDSDGESNVVKKFNGADNLVWTEIERHEFTDWWKLRSLQLQASATDTQEAKPNEWTQIKETRQRLDSTQFPIRTVYVSTIGTPEDQPIYVRGNTKNLGEYAPRGNLVAFGFQPSEKLLQEDPTGRLLFASQFSDPANPLTARVYVNRVWTWLMGRGIVPTPDNFGVLGELPTHPELLDYLAIEFMQNQWSTKALVKRIVLSRTYGQSTQGGADAFQLDPNNHLWHSAMVRRLDAESIRDTMIVLSGKLNPTMFGPSVKTFLTDFMQGRGRPEGGPLNGDWRRSIYLEVRRNFLNPMLLVFDSPVPLSTAGKRNASNVPAQSLTLLNDPLVDLLAEEWAKDIVSRFPATASGNEVHQRIIEMYLQALSRKPTQTELERISGFFAGDQPEIDSWKAFAHAIFNLKEFIFLQ